MTQEFNVKEMRFTPVTIATGFTAAGSLIEFSEAVNGRILDVEWTANGIGSLALQFSGNGIEFFRRNAPSGAGTQISMPRKLTDISTGSLAGMIAETYYLNDKMMLRWDIGSNAVGNTSGVSFNIKVKYQ